MLNLEAWMQLQELYQQGMSQSQIARELGLDRKTVRKYLKQPRRDYPPRPRRKRKTDPFVAYVRERWEQGVHNATKLFREIQQRGYGGGGSQVRELVSIWRGEHRERAFVRFETGPCEQAQMDWGTLGRFEGHRLYAFALTLAYSRMRYVEFTQRQDMETLLSCLVHAFHYFGGVTQTILTDNMKTVVLNRSGGAIHWNPRFLDFAAYYGFLLRVCQPYRPETKGKIESTIRFLKGNFWPGISFGSLADLNQQARAWLEEINGRVHGTTRAIPRERWAEEKLRTLDGQLDYDTSYVSFREVAKDCLLCYRGNRYSVPHAYAGKRVVVKEPVAGGEIRICHQHEIIAEHRLGAGRGVMVTNPEHYAGLPRRQFRSPLAATAERELIAGPGVGRHFNVPEVETRSLTVYEEVSHVVTV
jgi:transposase